MRFWWAGLLSLMSLVFVGSLNAAESKGAIGKILFAKGMAQVFPKNSETPRSAQPGSSFFAGDRIETRQGQIKLLFREGNNEVVLGPNSSLTIVRASAEGGENGTSLNLVHGELRSTVKIAYSGENTDAFEVQTPNISACIQGTAFVSHGENNSTESAVASVTNKVVVKSLVGSQYQVLDPGKYLESSSNDQLGDPRALLSNSRLKTNIANLSEDGFMERAAQIAKLTDHNESSASRAPASVLDSSGAAAKDLQMEAGNVTLDNFFIAPPAKAIEGHKTNLADSKAQKVLTPSHSNEGDKEQKKEKFVIRSIGQ